ncbi:hypothetical protein CRYUN_Cryun30bG0068800 [Craigia yunnanensis]
MGYSKDQLLARLKELQIDFSQYEHPVVLTVEAQAKYVGNMGGALSNNLFLEVLSQRLGLGKGGLRMTPEEALSEILQVPLGCVTPFAVVNESASHVSLLLDKGYKTQEHCFFHPLSNDMSIWKDQPPDLAAFVPSGSTVLPDLPEKVPSQDSTGNHLSAGNNSAAVTEKAIKPSGNVQNVKEKSVNGVQPSIPSADAGKFVEELLGRASALLLSEISEDSINEHGGQLGAEIANNIKKCLREDLKNLATIFKNTAYTEGFYAGTQYQPKRL